MDGGLWTAAAAFTGPVVAVLLGLLVFRFQQDSQQASQRFLADGIQRLYGTLSTLLSIHLLNYQIANYSIRLLKTYELGAPLAPSPDEVPRFLGADLDSLPIDSLLPVKELIGDRVVMDWVMRALSDVTLEAKEGDFQIRQPLAAYYGSDPAATKLDRDEAVRRLSAIVDAWESRVRPHWPLLDRLNDLASHIGRKRPWTFGGYYKIWQRSEVEEMRKQWRRGYRKALRERKKAEAVLRSGGVDAEAAAR